MNTAVINIKVSPDLKAEAQSFAKELGFSLSALIQSYLKQVLRTRTVVLSSREEPSEFLIRALKESAEDIKKGRVSPTFDNAKDAIKWLNNSGKKYASKVQ